MDGFYLAFVAVGAGLFWLSSRRRQHFSGALLAAWLLLGTSLASAVVLLVGSSDDRAITGTLSAHVTFEALRHLLLGAAVICLGLSFLPHAAVASPSIAPAEAKANAEALDALAGPVAAEA